MKDNIKEVVWNNKLDQQVYHWSDYEKSIICPKIGNLMQRQQLSNFATEYYVVVDTVSKNSKNNHNIVRSVTLYKVIKYDPVNKYIIYNENGFPMILTLSGVGTWFTRQMQQKYNWQWLTEMPTMLRPKIRISIKPNKTTNLVNDEQRHTGIV